MHQPCGEIVPSTTLQADGGWNCLQFSQRCSPFGVSWYFTFFCGVLACARATLTPAIDAPAAPAVIVRTRRRETPCCSVMTFHPEMRTSRKHGHIYTGQGVIARATDQRLMRGPTEQEQRSPVLFPV